MPAVLRALAGMVTLALLLPAAAGAGPAKLSGRLADASYDLILLARDGAAKPVAVGSDGRFSARVRTPAGASLHLLRDGRYAGPVVLRKRRPRVVFAAARRLALGTITPRDGYATIARRVPTSGRAIRTAADGAPLGAGRLGLVRVPGARAAQEGDPRAVEGADADRDGLANAFDADDDGDLTLDAIEGEEPAGVSLYLSSALPLNITETMNANAGADTDLEPTLQRYLRFLFGMSADEVPGATRAGVSCTFAWCAGAEIVIQPGLGESDTPWADGDGDGLLDLPREGPAFQEQIYPRATSAQVAPGDTFTATTDTGVTAVSALAMYFTSTLAVRSLGDHVFSYPVPANGSGTSADPVEIPGRVRITLWRPQRPAIPGAETGTQRDIGGLHYGVDMSGSFCRPGDFSDLSETLSVQPSEDPGGGEAPLRDSAPDAEPAGATLSFTLDAAACQARAQGDGGFPLLSVVAQDSAGDLTRQHIVVRLAP